MNKKYVIKFFSQFNDFFILVLLAAACVLYISNCVAFMTPLAIICIVSLHAALRLARSRRCTVTVNAGTPLQTVVIKKFRLLYICACLMIFILGLWKNIPLLEIFIAVSALLVMAQYSNLDFHKSSQLLIACGVGGITLLLAGLLMGYGTILSAVHVLFLYLLTDALPVTALSSACSDDESHETFSLRHNFLCRGTLEGIMLGMLGLLAYAIGTVYVGSTAGRSMAFAIFGTSLFIHSFNLYDSRSLFLSGALGGKMAIGFLSGVSIIIIVLSIAPGAFGLRQLTASQWLIVTGLCIVLVAVIEIEKIIQQRSGNRIFMEKSGNPFYGK